MKILKVLKCSILTLCFAFSIFAFSGCDDKKLNEVYIQSNCIETTVEQNSTFDISNLKVYAKFNKGEDELLDASAFTISNIDTSVLGEQQLTVTYKDLTYSVTVTVVKAVTGIAYKQGLPTTIYQDSVLQTSGVQITVTYSDLTTVDLTATANSGITFAGTDTSTVGEKTLTITYLGKTAQTTYTVSEDAVTGVVITSGTVADEVSANSTLNTSNLTLTATLLSGKTSVISAGFTVSEFNTSIVGEYNLVVTYGTKTATKKIKVTNDFTILGFSNPEFVANYSQNSNTRNTFTSTSSDGVKGFEVTGKQYLVGDDNNFIYQPTLQIRKSSTNSSINTFKTKIQVFMKNTTGNYEELTTNITDYVVIDDYNQTYDFTALAVGKEFKISVRPYYVSEDEEELVDNSEFEFKVVDGYNIYSAADLSVIDNVNSDNKWATLKEKNNISLSLNVNAVILHQNISIQNSDIPSLHFYTESEVAGDTDASRAVGSLKDSTAETLGYIYRRTIAEGSSFTIEGNYFTISANDIALVVRQSGKVSASADATITTHTTLFEFLGNDTGAAENFNLNNVSFYGNTKKSEDQTLSGGLICFKADAVSTLMENCLSQRWFINVMFQVGTTQTYKISKTNVFDANNCLLYNWGVENVFIESSHLIGAGGPVMINDHVDNNASTGEGGIPTNVITTNSVLESLVAGSENWFVSYGATSIAGGIKAMNALMTPYGKTLLDSTNTKLNLICVFKSGSTEGLTSSKIRGSFIDSNAKFTNGLDLSNTSINTIKTQTIESLAEGGYTAAQIASALENAAILQTHNGAIGMPNTSGWEITPDATKMANCESYMNFYLFNGMGAVFGLQ